VAQQVAAAAGYNARQQGLSPVTTPPAKAKGSARRLPPASELCKSSASLIIDVD
jgi:hypothetical protein